MVQEGPLLLSVSLAHFYLSCLPHPLCRPQVRIAACRALVAFGATLQRDYCETNAGYLAAGVVIHMDDADTAVQVRGGAGLGGDHAN